jgi:hypothetical protein
VRRALASLLTLVERHIGTTAAANNDDDNVDNNDGGVERTRRLAKATFVSPRDVAALLRSDDDNDGTELKRHRVAIGSYASPRDVAALLRGVATFDAVAELCQLQWVVRLLLSRSMLRRSVRERARAG